jgi:hypothetical protein
MPTWSFCSDAINRVYPWQPTHTHQALEEEFMCEEGASLMLRNQACSCLFIYNGVEIGQQTNGGFESRQRTIDFYFLFSSVPDLGPSKSPIEWVPGKKRPGGDANHSAPSIYLSMTLRALCWALAAIAVSWSYIQSVGLLGRGISHAIYTNTEYKHIDIYAWSGIQTHDTNVRAGLDHDRTHHPLVTRLIMRGFILPLLHTSSRRGDWVQGLCLLIVGMWRSVFW